MGSPGVFIHCGTLGGRFSAFSVAANALLPARPPATTAPPTNAPPSRRNRRRDVATRRLPVSVGSVIAGTPLEKGTPRTTQQSSVMFQGGRCLDYSSPGQAPLAEGCCACATLADESAVDRNAARRRRSADQLFRLAILTFNLVVAAAGQTYISFSYANALVE